MKNKLSVLILPFLTLAACSSTNNDKVDFVGETINVSVHQSEKPANANYLAASGKLIAKNNMQISTRMMGYITAIPVKIGQQVNAGQLLVTINNADLQAKQGQVEAQIKQVQTNFDLAKKDYERFQNLYLAQSASAKELDDMKARFEMSKAGLEAIKQMKNEVKAQFSYTNITAPISGVITAKFTEQGNMANPGMPLLTIESPSVLQAQVMVSEQIINQIKQGMKVKVLVKSIGKEVEGSVSDVSLSSAQTGGQYVVKIDIATHQDLLPGMFVNARFSNVQPTTANNNLFIPSSALVIKGQLKGVYTVSSQNTAILRWLTVGKTIGDNVEVLSGLKTNEIYISSADGKLYNGVKVNIK